MRDRETDGEIETDKRQREGQRGDQEKAEWHTDDSHRPQP